MANNATFTALSSYSRDLLEDADLVALEEELIGQSDRAFVIVMGTMVERALAHMLRSRLRDDGRQNELFEFGSPLGSFSGKIAMAFAIGCFGKNARRNLDYVRLIRNAAAHANRPISFNDEVMRNCCTLIDSAKIGGASMDPANARDWFFQCFRLLVDAMSLKAKGGPLNALEAVLS